MEMEANITGQVILYGTQTDPELKMEVNNEYPYNWGYTDYRDKSIYVFSYSQR